MVEPVHSDTYAQKFVAGKKHDTIDIDAVVFDNGEKRGVYLSASYDDAHYYALINDAPTTRDPRNTIMYNMNNNFHVQRNDTSPLTPGVLRTISNIEYVFTNALIEAVKSANK